MQDRGEQGGGGSGVGHFLGVGVDGGSGDIDGQGFAVAVEDQAALGRKETLADAVGVGLLLKIGVPDGLEVNQASGQQEIEDREAEAQDRRPRLNDRKMVVRRRLLSCRHEMSAPRLGPSPSSS